jgi:hypothetical protein
MYDLIISINVHEKIDFLLKQLEHISKEVHCNYAILLNCNDYMYELCTKNKLPKNVFVCPTILNKKRFHGSLTEGIYNNMIYALENVSFRFFLVCSSRNLFENHLRLYDLIYIVNYDKPLKHVPDGKPWEQIKDTWWWPSIEDTKLKEYILHRNNLFYSSPHEGLLLEHKDCILLRQFIMKHSELKEEIFNFDICMEELAIQTILKDQGGNFYYIGNGTCTTERNGPNLPGKGRYFMYKTERIEYPTVITKRDLGRMF